MQSNRVMAGFKGFVKNPVFIPFFLYLIVSTIIIGAGYLKISRQKSSLKQMVEQRTESIIRTSLIGTVAPFANQMISTGGDTIKLKVAVMSLRNKWSMAAAILTDKYGKVIWSSTKNSKIKSYKISKIKGNFTFDFFAMDKKHLYIVGESRVGMRYAVFFIPITEEILNDFGIGIPLLLGIYYKGSLISANSNKFPQQIRGIDKIFKYNIVNQMHFHDFTIAGISNITLPFMSKGPIYLTLILLLLVSVIFVVWGSFLSQVEAVAMENMREKTLLYNFSAIGKKFAGTGSEKYDISDIMRNFTEKYGMDASLLLDSDLTVMLQYPETKNQSALLNELMDINFKNNETVGYSSKHHFVIVSPILIENNIKVGWFVFFSKLAISKSHPIFEAISLFSSMVGLHLSKTETLRILKRISFLDPASYAYNMKYFANIAKEEVELASTAGYPISVILMDVDGFSDYVNSYSEEDGNAVIKSVGVILSRTLRNIDTVARVGNAEFAILMPRTNLDQGFILANKLKKRIENYPFPRQPLTVSIGLSSFTSFKKETLRSLIQRCEQALKTAKMEGGNKVITINPDITEV